MDRYYGIDRHTEATELHDFANSFNQAYGLVIYLHSKSNNEVKV